MRVYLEVLQSQHKHIFVAHRELSTFCNLLSNVSKNTVFMVCAFLRGNLIYLLEVNFFGRSRKLCAGVSHEICGNHDFVKIFIKNLVNGNLTL